MDLLYTPIVVTQSRWTISDQFWIAATYQIFAKCQFWITATYQSLPSVRHHHRSVGPNTWRNPGGRQKKILFKFVHQLIYYSLMNQIWGNNLSTNFNSLTICNSSFTTAWKYYQIAVIKMSQAKLKTYLKICPNTICVGSLNQFNSLIKPYHSCHFGLSSGWVDVWMFNWF